MAKRYYKSEMRYFIRPDKNRIKIVEDPDEDIQVDEDTFKKVSKLYNFQAIHNKFYSPKNEDIVAFKKINKNDNKYEYFLSKKFIHIEILRTGLQILKDIAKDFTVFDKTFKIIDKKKRDFYAYNMKGFYSLTINPKNNIGFEDDKE